MPLPKLHKFSALKAAPEAIRHQEFEGVDHIIVPIIALVEGIIISTQGDGTAAPPTLVKAEEFAKAIEMWNGRPVVINHPVKGGNLVSAGDPEIFEDEVIGTIFNATLLNGSKLKVEAWINTEKVEEIGGLVEETINRILNGEEVEISTGYFADFLEAEGFFDGEPFNGIQTDIKPDHLAILDATKVGACSWEDGCGAARLNECPILAERKEPMPKKPIKNQNTKNQRVQFNCEGCPNSQENKDSSVGIVEAFMQKFGKYLSFVGNIDEMSDTDKKQAVASALAVKGEQFFWIVAMFDSFVVYEKDFSGFLVSREFSIAEDGVITLGDEETPVRLETKVVPIKVNEDVVESKTPEEINAMNKAERIKALIANEKTHFAETDQAFLEGLSEEQLGKLEPILDPAPTQEEIDKAAADEATLAAQKAQEVKDAEDQKGKETDPALLNQKPQTTEEFLASTSPEIRESMQEAIDVRNERRADLVKGVMSHVNNTFKQEALEAMDLQTLKSVYSMGHVVNYQGQAGVLGNVLGNAEDNAIPAPPDAFDIKKPGQAS